MTMPTTQTSGNSDDRVPVSKGTHEAVVAEIVDVGEDEYQGNRHYQAALVIQVQEENEETDKRKEVRFYFNTHKYAKKKDGSFDWRPVTGRSNNGTPSKFVRIYEGILGKKAGEGCFWYPMGFEALVKDFVGKPFKVEIDWKQTEGNFPEVVRAFGKADDPIELRDYTPFEQPTGTPFDGDGEDLGFDQEV